MCYMFTYITLKQVKQTFAWKGPNFSLLNAHNNSRQKTVCENCHETTQWSATLTNPLGRYASPVNLPQGSLDTTWDNAATLKLQIGSLHFICDLSTSQLRAHDPKMDELSAHWLGVAIHPSGSVMNWWAASDDWPWPPWYQTSSWQRRAAKALL